MNAPQTIPATLAIVAGGAARRLGGFPKGMLVVDGQRVIDRLWSLHSMFQWSFIVTNDHTLYSPRGMPCVADRVTGKGAPGGVVTALHTAQTPWCCVLACDAPFVSQPDLLALWERVSPANDVVCFRSPTDGLQPLLAFYRTSLATAFERELTGNPSLQSLLERVRVDSVEAPAHVLVNLNTPEDLESARARRESF